MLLPTYEILVFEALSVLRVARLRKIVHVELTHKRRKVFVLEVVRQNFLSELVGLVDHEPRAI